MRKNKRKILVIGTADCVGGAASVGWKLGEELINRGWDIKYIVAYKNSGLDNVYQLKKNPLTSFLDENSRFNVTSLSRHLISFVLANDIDFGASKEILNHSWYKDADIVHCHNLHGNFFKLDTLVRIASEKPVIWTLHDTWAITAHCTFCFKHEGSDVDPHFRKGWGRYDSLLWDNSRYLWKRKKEIYEKCNYLNIVTPSEWLAERVKRSILKSKLLKVINNGIDTSVFYPRNKIKLRIKYNIPKSKKVILYVGQGGGLDRMKGSRYFLEVARKYGSDPDVIFICPGGIPKGGFVKKGNVIYIPNIRDKLILADYYSMSDLLIFPSLSENFPLVTIEALASGLPVVAFNVGGVKEQIKHKVNGYIAEYKSTKDLINGIEYIFDLSSSQLQEMKKENRERVVKYFSLSVMVNNYLKVYDNL